MPFSPSLDAPPGHSGKPPLTCAVVGEGKSRGEYRHRGWRGGGVCARGRAREREVDKDGGREKKREKERASEIERESERERERDRERQREREK